MFHRDDSNALVIDYKKKMSLLNFVWQFRCDPVSDSASFLRDHLLRPLISVVSLHSLSSLDPKTFSQSLRDHILLPSLLLNDRDASVFLEHSNITSGLREGECDALDNLIDEAGDPERLPKDDLHPDPSLFPPPSGEPSKKPRHPTAPIVRGISMTQDVTESQEIENELERRKAIEEKINLKKRKREEKEEKERERKRHKPSFV